MQFRSFRARILTLVLGLLLLVQAAVFFAVNTANIRNARRHIDESLEVTAKAFQRAVLARDEALLVKAGLLSGDFAFKEAAMLGEHETVLSALENHSVRLDADVMMLVSLEHEVIADTSDPRRTGVEFPWPGLIASAEESEFGEASGIELLDGAPFQLVLVPLFTPEPSAWVVAGLLIDHDFAGSLGEDTGSEVSLLREQGGSWTAFASTLAAANRQALENELAAGTDPFRGPVTLEWAEGRFVSLATSVTVAGEARVAAVLQRSLDEALIPYMRLRSWLFFVFALGLALSAVGGIWMAGRVTRPVASLASGARRIGTGDYSQPVEVAQQDELGVLATAFNETMRGLDERDRVRGLLGKVVSPAVAEELLNKGIELGGEERRVSILFSDIRGFTSLSEQQSPQQLLDWLNEYLNRVSHVIEEQGGVVDKFIGDAVMALFGAPLAHDDDPLRAVKTALGMQRVVTELNRELEAKGQPSIGIGVGINTGTVVAGNMGSDNRRNYTVIGDGVNLASRLESLTKRYAVPVIVSESTREACPGMAFRELDRVRVSGRGEALTIYQPLGAESELDAEARERLERHVQALGALRTRDWDTSEKEFRALAVFDSDDKLHEIYLQRIQQLRADPPGADWDGTVRFDQK